MVAPFEGFQLNKQPNGPNLNIPDIHEVQFRPGPIDGTGSYIDPKHVAPGEIRDPGFYLDPRKLAPDQVDDPGFYLPDRRFGREKEIGITVKELQDLLKDMTPEERAKIFGNWQGTGIIGPKGLPDRSELEKSGGIIEFPDYDDTGKPVYPGTKPPIQGPKGIPDRAELEKSGAIIEFPDYDETGKPIPPRSETTDCKTLNLIVPALDRFSVGCGA